jgi:hypothetical protein
MVFTLFSCRKDFERPNWDVDLLAPLVKSTLTLDDLLPDSTIQVNPDTSLKLVYQTNIFDIDMDSLFKIPDTTIVDVYSFPLSLIAAPGNSFYSNAEELKLNISNGVELGYALVESGFIEVEVFSEIKENIIITYTIPSATKNGDTLVLKELINAATLTQDGYIKKIIDLSGYELDLTGVLKTNVNTLITRAVGMVDTNATASVNIAAGEKITYKNKLVDIVPYYVKGYFGSQQYRFGPETTILTVFDRIIAGTLDIEQVDVNLDFENGIGVDAQLTINQFTTINTNNNTNAALSHSIMGTPINLNRAQETYSVPEVVYSSYNVSMNTSNSNIDQLIEVLPNQLMYDINLDINPYGNISGNNDFVFKKHPLKTNLNVEFPLSLIANNLTLVDTLDLSLSSESTTGNIIEGVLYLYADNGFPFDASIQLALYDENLNFIKDIIINDKILSAPVDAAYKVTQKKSSKVSIPLSESDIDALYNSGKIVIKIAFTTISQTQFIKIYDGYAIDIKLVGDFAYNVNPN